MQEISAADRIWPPANAAAGAGRLAARARWSACLTLALGVHAAAAAFFLDWDAGKAEFMSAPPIVVELTPEPEAPAEPVSDLAPGPAQPQMREAAKPEPQKPAETDRPASRSETAHPAPDAPASPEPQETAPVRTAAMTTARALPAEILRPSRPGPSQPDEAEPAHRKPALRQAAPAAATIASAPSPSPRQSARSAAPAAGAPSRNAHAVPNWQSALLARLERYKRYPDEARGRGERGVTQLAFSVDRGGGVHRARITRSSGSDALDRAALHLLQRAQPLPPPPAEIKGTHIAIVVPIRYHFR